MFAVMCISFVDWLKRQPGQSYLSLSDPAHILVLHVCAAIVTRRHTTCPMDIGKQESYLGCTRTYYGMAFDLIAELAVPYVSPAPMPFRDVMASTLHGC